MILFKKFAFWFSLISLFICLRDYWVTIEKDSHHFIGLSPFEPFSHWMIKFESSTVDATVEAKFPGYMVHLAFFFSCGLFIDLVLRLLKRKKQSVDLLS